MTNTTTLRAATAATLQNLINDTARQIAEGFNKLTNLRGAAANAVEKKLERLLEEEERIGAQLREQLEIEEAKLASIEEEKRAQRAEEEAARASLREQKEAEELALGEGFGSAVAAAISAPSAALSLLIGAGDEDSELTLVRTWEQLHQTLDERDERCRATRAALNEAIVERDRVVREARGVKPAIRRRRQAKIDTANEDVGAAKEAWVDAVVGRCLVDAEIEQLRAAGIEGAIEELAAQRREREVIEYAQRREQEIESLKAEFDEVTRLSRNYRVLASRIDAQAFKTRDGDEVRKLRGDQHAAEFRARLCLSRRSELLRELRAAASESRALLGVNLDAELDELERDERQFVQSYQDFSDDLRLCVEQQVGHIERKLRASRGAHTRFASRKRSYRANRRAKATETRTERGIVVVA